MTSPYDPEAIAFAMAGGVVGTLAALREENARLRERSAVLISGVETELRAAKAEVERLRAEMSKPGAAWGVAERLGKRAEAAEAKLDIANRKLVECGEVWDAQEAKLAEAVSAMESRGNEISRWQEKWADAEAKLAEAHAEKLKLEEAGLLMLKLRDKAEAEVERLRAVVMDFHWLYGFFKDRGSVSDAVKTRLDKIDAALAPEVKPCPVCHRDDGSHWTVPHVLGK